MRYFGQNVCSQVNPTLIVFLQDVTSEMEVRAMPTFMFILNGKEIHKIVGANKLELEKKVEDYSKHVAVAWRMQFANVLPLRFSNWNRVAT